MVKDKKNQIACDEFVRKFEAVVKTPKKSPNNIYYTGVDLGTACIVLAVLNEAYEPVAGAYRYADVVKDGMVVDYIGAIRILRELKEELENKLDTELIYAAAAIPPGTDELDGGAVKNVVMGAGFELTAILDEPTAANRVLNTKNGVVVDIGGGTTGIAILKNGKVIHVADDSTGGYHFSLVLSGAYKIPYQEAEEYKRNRRHHQEILPVVKPVVEKIGSIIKEHIKGFTVQEINLVGGSSCLIGIEKIIEKQVGIKTNKPVNPMFVTPLGIALSCTDQPME